jgi:hypothetical protein
MKSKKSVISILLILQLIVYFSIQVLWSNCINIDCSVFLVDAIFAPFEMMAVVLSIYFAVFLLLPAHYFEAWLKRIFSWAFPVSILFVLGADGGRNIMSLSKAETVLACGGVFGVLSLIFLIYWWRKTKASDAR